MLLVIPQPESALQAQLVFTGTQSQHRSEFVNNLDVYNWNYTTGYGRRVASGAFFAGLAYTTTLQQREPGDVWKSNQRAWLMYTHPIFLQGELLARVQYNALRDEFSQFNYDRKQSGTTFAGSWRLFNKLLLQPELGYRWEQRLQLLEHGAYTGLAVRAANLEHGAYEHNVNGWLERSRFGSRKNATTRLNYALTHEFSAGTRDSLSIYYDFLRRDNFLSETRFDQIESLQRWRRGLFNALSYQVSANMRLRWQTHLDLGKVDISRRDLQVGVSSRQHDDLILRQDVHLDWRSRRFAWQAGVDFSENTVEYSFSDSIISSPLIGRFASLGYDVSEKRASLFQRLHFTPGRRDSTRFYLSLDKLQYDNTDATNPDSHDEQRWQFALLHQHRLRDDLTLSLELSGFLRHFIYIDRRLSAQNNWNRILQLTPIVDYRPSPEVHFRQKAGVRTQYVDFDFETSGSAISSYVVRDFFLADSLAWPLWREVRATIDYRLEFEEVGSLVWARFSSLPRSLRRKQWFSLKLAHAMNNGFRIAAGATYYQQARWQYIANPGGSLSKDYTGAHTNLGPVAEIVYNGRNGTQAVFSAQRQKAFPFTGQAYYINYLKLAAYWVF